MIIPLKCHVRKKLLLARWSLFAKIKRMASSTPPRISVIMPVYNAEKFLSESIDSILRQTFSDFEFIIINDGSTDSSQKIVDSYAKRDDRIKVHKQTNHGVVFTANKAIDLARGDYIARIDADDVAMPDRLQQQFDLLEKNQNAVLVCSDFEIFSDSGEFRYREVVPPDSDAIKQLLYIRNPIANGSTLIRKSALVEVGLFDNVFAEDFHMWMKLMEKGDFLSTGTMLYRWRMNPTGLTLSNNKLSQEKSEVYIAELWQNNPPRVISRQEIKQKAKSYIEDYGKRGRAYREIYLTDLSRLASKFVIRKHPINGIHQLFNIATSGRSGLKVALQRIYFIIRGRVPSHRSPLDE